MGFRFQGAEKEDRDCRVLEATERESSQRPPSQTLFSLGKQSSFFPQNIVTFHSGYATRLLGRHSPAVRIQSINSEVTLERSPTVASSLLTGLGQTFLRSPSKPEAMDGHFSSLSQGQTCPPLPLPPFLSLSLLFAFISPCQASFLSAPGRAPTGQEPAQ